MDQLDRTASPPVSGRRRARVAAAVVALGFGGPIAAVAQVPKDGQWIGIDSRGDPVSFIVSAGGTEVTGAYLQTSCLGILGKSAVSSGQFAFSASFGLGLCVYSYAAAGAFSNESAASGTSSYIISGGGASGTCRCSDQRTWTASFARSGSGSDLTITRNHDGRMVASPNAATTYEIDVTNAGPDPVSTFRLLDSPPLAETSPAWSASSGSYEPSTGVWAGPPLLAGQTVSLRVSGHLSADANGEARNMAQVLPLGFVDPVPFNNTLNDVTLVRTLAVQFSGPSKTATPPTSIALATSLANQGTVAAENVMVSVPTPSGLTFAGNTGACTTPFPCLLGTMPPEPAAGPHLITSVFELPKSYAGPDGFGFEVTVTTTTPEATAPQSKDFWGITVIHPAPALFNLLEPCRIMDTRSSAPIAANAVLNVAAVGVCGVPASARALALNVTVVGPTGDGNLRLYPTDLPVLASALNFRAGQIRANNVVIGLGSGALSIQADMTAGSLHVILDVSGYFEGTPPLPTEPGS